ncbi:hypothetical protein JT359_05515 [Candidatus Poribacteria bacterium]|nr:hypothetical protein [Candidatus Poribacteria bacterium]
MKKIYSGLILLLLIHVFTISGCGSDDGEPDKEIIEPVTPQPEVIPTELLGTWRVISLNDGLPLAFINAEEPDIEDRPKEEISVFTYSFQEDGTWMVNVEFEMFDFPEDPNRGDIDKAGRIEVSGIWSGSYSINNSVLSLITLEQDLKIISRPPEFLDGFAEGGENAAKEDLMDKFNMHLLNAFEKTNFTVTDGTLTLEATGSGESKLVLEKE